MTEFFEAISNFGFPIVVSGFLLLRIEKKLEKVEGSISKNTISNYELKESINRLNDHVGYLTRDKK